MALYPIEIAIENIDPTPSGTAVISTVTVGTTAISILPAKAERKGFSVFNNSSRRVYLGNSNSVFTREHSLRSQAVQMLNAKCRS
jgi:hypothetical protein